MHLLLEALIESLIQDGSWYTNWYLFDVWETKNSQGTNKSVSDDGVVSASRKSSVWFAAWHSSDAPWHSQILCFWSFWKILILFPNESPQITVRWSRIVGKQIHVYGYILLPQVQSPQSRPSTGETYHVNGNCTHCLCTQLKRITTTWSNNSSLVTDQSKIHVSSPVTKISTYLCWIRQSWSDTNRLALASAPLSSSVAEHFVRPR